jgi:hypothetical protein
MVWVKFEHHSFAFVFRLEAFVCFLFYSSTILSLFVWFYVQHSLSSFRGYFFSVTAPLLVYVYDLFDLII